MLLYGSPGAGKKTLVMAILRQVYGAGVEKVRLCFPCAHRRPQNAARCSLLCQVCCCRPCGATKQVRVESRPWTIELPSRKLEVDLTTLSSNYHLELNPSDVGNNDRYVVQVRGVGPAWWGLQDELPGQGRHDTRQLHECGAAHCAGDHQGHGQEQAAGRARSAGSRARCVACDARPFSFLCPGRAL